MRDRELVLRIKDATDLLAMVGQAVQLRRQGSAWVGRCPFHSERTPSFQVVPDRGFYHCFGCGKHGDAFTWLMEREGLSFGEAMEQLARAAGIELPRQRERSSAEVDLETRMRTVLEAAQEFYERRFRESPKAREYLAGRGISSEFAKEAGFGFAPDAWEALVTHLRQQGFSSELVEQAGLASRNDRGNTLDFLRDRLTIPIHDARGRLIAFGGRAFGDAKPKYLNTRETPLFNKGGILFGFHRAKGQMRDGALVVEGYFDVLMLHQEGIHQAVAPLGTALTAEHLKLVSRFTKRLVLCFDGDAAGLGAMEKSLKLALPMGFDIRLLLLPSGEDPDTWCTKLGAEGFKELLRGAPDWTSFVINRALEGKDLRRIPDRMSALRDLAAYLAFLPPSPDRRELFASLSHQLQIPLAEFDRAVQARTHPSEASPEPEPSAAEKVDELLRPLLILCRDPEIRAQISGLPHAWWETLEGAPFLQCLLDVDGDEALLPPEVLAQLRHFEAIWASKDEAEKVPERIYLKLEQAFVLREIQANNRMLLDPSVISDATLARNLEQRQADLLGREKGIQRQLRAHR
ncbi:DNA primase [Holophaga foetida]|uniref:DNA primase n=1 Tax=Holophaga foetida TaxID=35839 RepID=UPI0002474A4D|nr:DNA primase [Holophaga foetida]